MLPERGEGCRCKAKPQKLFSSSDPFILLLYLRRIETGNNEVLKRILEDSKKHKKSKWWETTRKYMNWAQIEEREIKEKTAKEIRGKIAKVVEEEWREEMEKKNSLRIYRRFKKEMKEEEYSGSLESMVWLRARTNSLNLGENSWQRNRDAVMLKSVRARPRKLLRVRGIF